MRVHLPLLDNLTAIEVARRNGLDVELNFDTRKFGVSKDEIIRTGAVGRGIAKSVHGPFMDLNPGALDEDVARVTATRFHWAIEVAELLGVGDLILHDGYVPLIYGYQALKENWLKKAMEMFNEAAGFGEKKGVRILIENMFTDDPLMIKEIVSGIGLGICLDVGHANFSSKIPLTEWLRALGPLIKEVHAHDNRGQYDEHLALGSGSIDFAPLQGLIPKFTLELTKEEDIQRSLRYLRDKKWI